MSTYRSLSMILIAACLISCFSACESIKEKQEFIDTAIDQSNQPKDSATFPLQSDYQVEVKELTDQDYPDNPDIGYRSTFYQQFSHTHLNIKIGKDTGSVTFVFESGNEDGSTVTLANLDINTFLIGVPEHVKKDKYLTLLGMVNQEWNRQQVKFTRENPELVIGEGEEGASISRVDLARNCLNSGLWEIIMWRTEGQEEEQVYYHGWFDFPLDLYGFLVSRKNNLDFEQYRPYCEEWIGPMSNTVNLNVLRTIVAEQEIQRFEDLQKGFYPKKGARLKKYKNIIYPIQPNKISEFLTDETRFATFSQPGYYNTSDPRKTELGRFTTLEGISLFSIKSLVLEDNDLFEVKLSFTDHYGARKTTLLFGGIAKSEIPALSVENMNDGYKMPMGIANHSFYESYYKASNEKVNDNPYYGFILDEQGKWLDSHTIGIDGPLMHWDDKEEGKLHIWLLSFERHAFVGHYTIQLKTDNA